MIRDHNYRIRYIQGAAVVAFGRHGAGEPLSGEALLALLGREGSRVVCDIPSGGGVTSAVLGQLITLHRKSQAGGARIRIVVPEGATREVFGITKLDRMLGVYGTLADALRDF
jgi:hypothetical protein